MFCSLKLKNMMILNKLLGHFCVQLKIPIRILIVSSIRTLNGIGYFMARSIVCRANALTIDNSFFCLSESICALCSRRAISFVWLWATSRVEITKFPSWDCRHGNALLASSIECEIHKLCSKLTSVGNNHLHIVFEESYSHIHVLWCLWCFRRWMIVHELLFWWFYAKHASHRSHFLHNHTWDHSLIKQAVFFS